MTKTMIQISSDLRDKIKSLGRMGDTYEDVLQRMYENAVASISANVFLDTSDSEDIRDILKERGLM